MTLHARTLDALLEQFDALHADAMRRFQTAVLVDAARDGANLDIDAIDAALADCARAWLDLRARLRVALAAAMRGEFARLDALTAANGSADDDGPAAGAAWARLDA